MGNPLLCVQRPGLGRKSELCYQGYIGVTLGLYWGNGKENGNYYKSYTLLLVELLSSLGHNIFTIRFRMRLQESYKREATPGQ